MANTEIATTADLIETQARENGSRSAISVGGSTYTYKWLNGRANQVARKLRSMGVRAGDRVAILAHNGVHHYELLLGCAKVQAMFMPVNWRLSPREITYLMEDAEPSLLVYENDFASKVSGAKGRGSPEMVDMQEWVRGVEGESESSFEAAASADDVILVMYTSGTTGAPKGVQITNKNLWSIVPIARDWGLNGQSVVQVCMPLFHMSGMGWSFPAMYMGGHIALMKEPQPESVVDSIAKHGVTETLLVPAVLQFVLQGVDLEKYDLSSLRTVFYGGSPIPEALLRELIEKFGCDFMQLYGLTESSGLVSYLRPENHHGERLRSCGQAARGVEMKIVDPVSGMDRDTGEVGEVWVRSAAVMKGYWGKEEETRESMTESGWLRTGDAGFLDEEGFLFLVDRVKDMIVSGGENVYPVEVENVLHEHPAVADAAVIGVPDQKWGEAVKAIVVGSGASSPEEEELVTFCRERLAHYKCPKSVELREELPRNASGKVLKNELKEPFWEGESRRVR